MTSVYLGRLSFNAPDHSQGEDPTGENAVNASGDSGGPMMLGEKIVGVSSSVSVAPQGQQRNGNYTNLNYAPIKKFFEDLETKYNLQIDCE